MENNHKSWLWRKKSSEKTNVEADKVKGVEEELQILQADKAELENELNNLNDKLSSALSECKDKDDLAKKHEKMAQEAMAGWEEVKAKAVSLKQELEEAVKQRVDGEERIAHIDAALKECMQQLRFVREEQEKRVHDAVMKTSREFEESQMILEEKLEETNKMLAKIVLENTRLSKSLLVKEKLIEELNKQKAKAEADFKALMTRLESTEKDNTSLKYEVRVLEKELEIRNEEREFNRRTADASHKQHLESAKKIAKLESECQRLRLLVRKRLPGPAALAKMKSEVEVLGRDSFETRRRRSNSGGGFIIESAVDNYIGNPSKKINFLAERLHAMEEENRNLKEALQRKTNEIQYSRAMYARSTSKSSQAESHLDELPKGHNPLALESSRTDFMSHELSLASVSDISSDDKVSCAESWAAALISELEHFKNGKQKGPLSSKTIEASEMNLMDDFIEMERLAIVSVDKQSSSPKVPPRDGNAVISPLDTGLNGYSSEATGREIIPLSMPESGVTNHEMAKATVANNTSGWLQDILKVVLEQNRVTQRKPDEILEDVREALATMSHGSTFDVVDTRENPRHSEGSNSLHFGGYISWKPMDKSSALDSSGGRADVEVLSIDRSKQSDLSKSICKIIELIEGITLQHYDYGTSELSSKDGTVLPYKNAETASGYLVRMFQWKTSELRAVFQQFVHTCYDLLNGKSNLDRFARELSSALEWTINHCFSLQDVSSMKYAIKKHLDWDESRSECEAEVGKTGQFSREQLSCFVPVTASNGQCNSFEKNEVQSTTTGEKNKLKEDLLGVESERKDLEVRLQSATDEVESLLNQLQESEKTVMGLQTELETVRGSKTIMENKVEDRSSMREDLDTQLTVAKVELNVARQKLSSLEVELDNKNSSCEELEATCLELQLQLESMTKQAIPDHELHQEEKQLRTDLEITAASEKLAECQETILNLGKQLKALASPREAALFDKVISSPTDTNNTSVTSTTTAAASITTSSAELTASKSKTVNHRSSLLDRMLAEDSHDTKDTNSLETTGNSSNLHAAIVSNRVIEPLEKILLLNGAKHQDGDGPVNSLAIVPSKKRGGGGLWRKLLWRKRKSNSKKLPLPFNPRGDSQID